MVKIKVIIGSSRPNRFAEQPGKWILEVGKNFKEAEFELVDLAAINLPFLDESMPPAMGMYQHEHTKAWSRIVGEADGFVIVTPEYNHGYSAVLKNAIDFIYKEWSHKPMAFVSYGGVAGGARAVEQLRAIAGHLSAYDITEHIILPNYPQDLDESGKFKFTDRHVESATTMLGSLIEWAQAMKPVREKLALPTSE